MHYQIDINSCNTLAMRLLNVSCFLFCVDFCKIFSLTGSPAKSVCCFVSVVFTSFLSLLSVTLFMVLFFRLIIKREIL